MESHACYNVHAPGLHSNMHMGRWCHGPSTGLHHWAHLPVVPYDFVISIAILKLSRDINIKQCFGHEIDKIIRCIVKAKWHVLIESYEAPY